MLVRVNRMAGRLSVRSNVCCPGAGHPARRLWPDQRTSDLRMDALQVAVLTTLTACTRRPNSVLQEQRQRLAQACAQVRLASLLLWSLSARVSVIPDVTTVLDKRFLEKRFHVPRCHVPSDQQ